MKPAFSVKVQKLPQNYRSGAVVLVETTTTTATTTTTGKQMNGLIVYKVLQEIIAKKKCL